MKVVEVVPYFVLIIDRLCTKRLQVTLCGQDVWLSVTAAPSGRFAPHGLLLHEFVGNELLALPLDANFFWFISDKELKNT